MQITQALMSSDEEDEGNRTLTASVKRWWTGGRLERQAFLPFHPLCVQPRQVLQPVLLSYSQISGSQQASATVHCVCLQDKVLSVPRAQSFSTRARIT